MACLILAMIASGIDNANASSYLSGDQIPNALNILPAPPRADSSRFQDDKATYKPLSHYSSKEVAAAQSIVDLTNLNTLFSNAAGVEITPTNTPATYHLLSSLVPLVANQSLASIKAYYHRTRPFAYYDQRSCSPDVEKQLRQDGSYPSGHAATAWVLSLVLSQLLPERSVALLKRGEQIGQLRVVCGVHWQSDVDAGRLYGSTLFAALAQSAQYQQDFKAAQTELQYKYKHRPYTQSLYSPTFVAKLGGKWFIVDCWQSRILWNTHFDPDISHWKTMASGFSAHDVAYDPRNQIWATEDTEHAAVNFYRFKNNSFVLVDRLTGLGRRTHRLYYDARWHSFDLLAATTGDFFRIRFEEGKPVIISKTRLPYAHKPRDNNFEIRSFTLHDGKLYFVSSLATPYILVVKNDKALIPVRKIPVPNWISNMQDITFLPDGHVFIDADYKQVALINDIHDISKAHNQYTRFPFMGSPYWLTFYKNHLIIPEIGYSNGHQTNAGYNGIGEWRYDKGTLVKEKNLIGFSTPTLANIAQKNKISFQIYH